MKRKKELIVILSSLLVIVLSVSVAYFTTKILGTGKEISVESADLKVIFTSGSGTINGTNIEPGWSSGENTFTVKNESNGTYKYNIIIKDLVNTFVTEGFLVYKITSTDGGYTMTDFEDVPKSKTSKDTILAYNISIDKDATHTYTVEYKYLESTEVDQSADMGKTLTGKIFITKGTERPTLANQLLNDNPTIGTRNDFSTPFTTNTVNTLYKSTENGTDVYYFAGAEFVSAHCKYNDKIITKWFASNAITKEICQAELTLCEIGDKLYYGHSNCSGENGTSITTTEGKWVESVEKPINNWVKFGKYAIDGPIRGHYSDFNPNFITYTTMEECTSASSYNYNCAYAWKAGDDIYWRIIRTNADGSVRLLYSGASPDTLEGVIDKSEFNASKDSPKYVGYMYGDTDTTLDEARTNTNNSTIKTVIDNWYANNMKSYTKYLSTTAVYCNDRELASGETYSTSSSFDYAANTRLDTNKTPTYDCTNDNDKFTVDASAGNGKLTYPIALMTADEISYAGGVYNTIAPMWYYTNSSLESSIGRAYWWSLSPHSRFGSSARMWRVRGNERPGDLTNYYVSDLGGVRPAISLKSCVQWKSGDGSASNPYEISTTSGC